MKEKLLRICALAFALPLAASLAHAGGGHDGGHDHGTGDAIGKPGVAAKVTRTIRVEMTDAMRFTPSDITVKQGETVRLVVVNTGQLKHELVLGTQHDLKEHYESMLKNPQMAHADPNMVTLAAGKSGEMVWQFTKAGRVDFGCLQPGHYDLGMKGSVVVAKAGALTLVGTGAASAPAR